MDKSNFQSSLDALREEYRRNLPTKIGEIEKLWRQLDAAGWSDDACKMWLRQVHSLAGSGTTYGFAQVTDCARALEYFAKEMLPHVPPSDAERRQIEALLVRLQLSATQPAENASSAAPRTENSPTLEPPVSLTPKLWLCELDAGTTGELSEPLQAHGYAVEPIDVARLCNADENLPTAVVVDWDIAQKTIAAPERACILQLHQRAPLLPILFLAGRDDLDARLEAVRCGATAFLVKPVDTTTVLETLETQVGGQSREPYRILIVEDDDALASYYAQVLREAGMLTRVVTNPLDVMGPLIDFRPDLILTDINMPHVSGLELAAILRQQEAYNSIPLVFVSGELNVDKRLEALLLGGDDFLTKPVLPEHLTTTVQSRARRARILRGLAERDSLTGLLNHVRFTEQLGIEVARAKRTRTSLAYAMLDIDRFKTVNDTFGHPTGDRVIKSFARLLQERLRRSDILGRYGGEEFAIILPETEVDAAWRVMEEIRSLFGQIRQQGGGTEFSVTVSGGVATMPPAVDALSLNENADRALYQAKRGGRNQIVTMME